MAGTAKFPYLGIPREARWGAVVDGKAASQIDPHYKTRLRISPTDKIASAGSCFAQKIAELLQGIGYNYFITEQGPPFLSAADKARLGYGIYSARYGNIYSVLQLLQLFRRAFGQYEPVEPLWHLPNGSGFIDPFRPSVQPGGFDSEAECLWDRKTHLAAVRRLFEEVDIFTFTLGLTETWCSAVDGAAFPACPGSSLGGEYDPTRHVFHNFSAAEVSAHLDAFVTELKAVNPSAQIILTISPIPLLATFEPQHVLQANTYSKAVLRVACEDIVRRYSHVHYFASYEIVTATGDSRQYFLDDHRAVSDAAVAHVMACFKRQFTALDENEPAMPQQDATPQQSGNTLRTKPMCDEDQVMAALAAHDELERKK